MSFWDRKKVLVTGGAGFIGSHVVEELLKRGKGVRVTVADRRLARHGGNLKEVRKDIRLMHADFLSPADCRKACRGQDIVLNLAARVAGVGYNARHHGTMFHDNIILAANMIEAARRAEAERFLVVSSACVYSDKASVPTPETEGFWEHPAPTNRGYGWAKRMAEYLGQSYHDEFGLKVAIARPYNAYGPRDHYGSADSHVIAALIRRVVGGEDPVLVWGDGSQSRAFLYVADIARGLLDVTERHAQSDPVNLGTDEEVTIRRLAELILRLAGSKARLKFDPSKPAGQARRNCDTAKAKTAAGFEARVGLEEGLRLSIEWYRRHRKGTK